MNNGDFTTNLNQYGTVKKDLPPLLVT